jgi:hypothetical protein
MNNFNKASMLIAATLAVSVASAAPAQVQFNVPSNLPIAKSTLTRAEVTADLLVWRASGLSDLNAGERVLDTNTPEYLRATARYNYMRASPQFAVLVDQIHRGGSTSVVVASR